MGLPHHQSTVVNRLTRFRRQQTHHLSQTLTEGRPARDPDAQPYGETFAKVDGGVRVTECAASGISYAIFSSHISLSIFKELIAFDLCHEK
jgi:hypothetical protein